jgi:hypothetical protein
MILLHPSTLYIKCQVLGAGLGVKLLSSSSPVGFDSLSTSYPDSPVAKRHDSVFLDRTQSKQLLYSPNTKKHLPVSFFCAEILTFARTYFEEKTDD